MSRLRVTLLTILCMSAIGHACRSQNEPVANEFCRKQQALKNAFEAENEYQARGEANPEETSRLAQDRQRRLDESLRDPPSEIKPQAEIASKFLKNDRPSEAESQQYIEAYGEIIAYTRETCGFDPQPEEPKEN